MRKINSKLLKQKIKALGKNGINKIAFECDTSTSILSKMANGTYMSTPSLDLAMNLCKALNSKIDDLFPNDKK